MIRLALLHLAMLVCISTNASAMTYGYEGSEFTSGNRYIAFGLSFAEPLSANLDAVDVVPEPSSVFHIEPGVYYDLDDATSSAVRLSTDGDGNITHWAISFTWNATAAVQSCNVSEYLGYVTTNCPEWSAADPGGDVYSVWDHNNHEYDPIGASLSPGTWTTGAWVPEPSTALLMGLGLAGLAASKRRR